MIPRELSKLMSTIGHFDFQPPSVFFPSHPISEHSWFHCSRLSPNEINVKISKSAEPSTPTPEQIQWTLMLKAPLPQILVMPLKPLNRVSISQRDMKDCFTSSRMNVCMDRELYITCVCYRCWCRLLTVGFWCASRTCPGECSEMSFVMKYVAILLTQMLQKNLLSSSGPDPRYDRSAQGMMCSGRVHKLLLVVECVYARTVFLSVRPAFSRKPLYWPAAVVSKHLSSHIPSDLKAVFELAHEFRETL